MNNIRVLYETVHVPMDLLADPTTQPKLLPTALVQRDNSRRMHHYKLALRAAMERCLTDKQREQLLLYYSSGLRKSEIARRQNTTCSAVSKSMRIGEDALREYIEQYMRIYNALEREFLMEE